MDSWKMANSIARAIESGLSYNDMFNNDLCNGKIPSKYFIENLTKEQKKFDPIGIITEHVEDIRKLFKNMPQNEKIRAHIIISSLLKE